MILADERPQDRAFPSLGLTHWKESTLAGAPLSAQNSASDAGQEGESG